MADLDLPVPVLSHPHWRVNYRPSQYESESLSSLNGAFEVVEKYKVSFRGWDFPHLSRRENERAVGNNWVASWSSFQDRYEYWRLYQSGQFIHLAALDEDRVPEWKQELQARFKSMFRGWESETIGQINGFVSINSLLYTITEVFEFAARLSSAGIYKGSLSIKVNLNGVRNFALVPERLRVLYDVYKASENEIGTTWQLAPDQLASNAPDLALDATMWFLERFSWLNPPREVLRGDQIKLITRNY